MAHTKNFGDVIRKRLAADPALAKRVENEAINAHIAGQIYQWRTEAELTQDALAKRAGLSQPVIARLEDADYDGHSITPLKKIADALGCNLRIEFYKKPQYTFQQDRTVDWPAMEVNTTIQDVSVTVSIRPAGTLST
jgi:transcriptional regulator with XRE-family HTH domain